MPDLSGSYRTADIARGDADSLLAAKAECPADDLFSELAAADEPTGSRSPKRWAPPR
ncbi:hypothetical protein HYG77_01055 [Rhodococcus sp. ZPP]|uniref:hypothetical protein n=1 Tax=Rhodococcus sp. ZPP TaxID=2749906 RepID=UPI001AD871EE|nr:hypothetical protein [Rhodococcus sp. ZPP]QTJ64336.1 hypothetical protein HYG77_01055 [Rhodococcus sp. ZPP]